MGTTYADLFGANLRAARARANLSQGAVAARMRQLGFDSWDGSKVSRAERGTQPVVVADLLALAYALECTMADLVGVSTAPDVLVEFEGAAVGGVSVRNSSLGWNDRAVTWDGSEPVVTRPAEPQSARAWDQSSLILQAGPHRLARQAS